MDTKMKRQQWHKMEIPQTGEEAFYGFPLKEPYLPIPDGYGYYGVLLQNGKGEEADKVQCHICGKWFGALGAHVIMTHGYDSATAYKDDIGFMRGTALVPERERLRRSAYATKYLKQYSGNSDSVKNYSKGGLCGRAKQESLNLKDTCGLQLLRQLKGYSAITGKPSITVNELRTIAGSYFVAILKRRFGSFNRAKTMAQLIIKPSGGQMRFTRKALVQDMARFYQAYGRHPTRSDFSRGLLLCHTPHPIYRFFSTMRDARKAVEEILAGRATKLY